MDISNYKKGFMKERNNTRKYIIVTAFVILVLSFLFAASYLVLTGNFSSDSRLKSLKSENRIIKKEYSSLLEKYEKLEERIDSLALYSNKLRIAANLNQVSDEERAIGTGGSEFNTVLKTSSFKLNKVVSGINGFVDKISAKINFEKNNFNEIDEKLKLNEKLFSSIPALKPIDGIYGDSFGMRMHPILKIKKMHNGLDFVALTGTRIYSPGAGRVSFAGRRGGYGNTVEINHGFGYKTLYGHLSEIKVRKGQKLKRGDLIALSGNSGKFSTGPHLHYEVRHNGVALNPRNFIYDNVNIFEIASK